VGATHDGDDSGDGGLRAKLRDECSQSHVCSRCRRALVVQTILVWRTKARRQREQTCD
jgi:hypothetical protein